MTSQVRRQLFKRHSCVVRVTHWVNAAALCILLMSGLQIFNAHPALYWGNASTFAEPWLTIDSSEQAGQLIGYTQIGGYRMTTTGILGLSVREGQVESRAFPAWASLPASQDLATGRRWHFLIAWLFAFNLTLYLVSGLLSGHIRRDLLPSRREIRPLAILGHLVDHARLRFPEGDAARSYNVLQKTSYLSVVAIALPLTVVSGCTMSPTIDAAIPWLIDLFGGRQSARSVHFITANAIVAFVFVHLVMVLLSGAWNNIRSMTTGWYAVTFRDKAHED